MGNTKKEIKKSETKQKLDEKIFQRINEKFRQYWRYLFGLIFIYTVSYIIWVLAISGWVRGFLDGRGWNEGKAFWFVVLGAAIIQGLLFSMDGFVTALLKSPFNQMCYAINRAEGISDEKKDYIITKATESNEHCKETLKKFGILTISGEVIRIIVLGATQAGDEDKFGKWWFLLNISYLIPIFFAAIDVWQIRRELKKMKKELTKL